MVPPGLRGPHYSERSRIAYDKSSSPETFPSLTGYRATEGVHRSTGHDVPPNLTPDATQKEIIF